MDSSLKTQNDIAWESLFEKYDILNKINADGKFIISASEIKKYREPRLMAKFDHCINLPQIFAANKLAILPISRGEYIISRFKAYQSLESYNDKIEKASLPQYLQSIDPNNIPSETIAINCALAAGMLHDFLAEEILHATVSGRMGSGQFDFRIANMDSAIHSCIDVNNAQIEIDAAFEGIETMALLEAKNDIPSDFLVRQLYYPFRTWQSQVTKKVRPVFLTYSNFIFNFYEYEFKEPEMYNSLILIKHKSYSIEDTAIDMTDLIEVTKQISGFVPEPKISFPQADSFMRVINICELLKSQNLSRNDVTESNSFDIRQTNYYTDAARYLGLIEKERENKEVIYHLSELGKTIMHLKYKQRQLALCKCILEHKVFYDVFMLCESGCVPDKNVITHIMKNSELYNIDSDNTFFRRASTIAGWINWMLGLIQE